jgi:arylsulfatase A-like enzyme
MLGSSDRRSPASALQRSRSLTRRRAAALLLFSIAGLAACRGGSRIAPWVRVDLAARRPDRVDRPHHFPRGVNGSTRYWPLGPVDLHRHIPRAPKSAAQDPFPADGIAAVLQSPGSRLVYEVTPGKQAFLSFVPLPAEQGGGGGEYRVAVSRDGEPRVELYARSFARGAVAAAAEQTIDLSRYAGVPIALELEVGARDRAPAKPSGQVEGWGALAVQWRQASPPGPAEVSRPRRSARPNFLLLGLDTTRADALGAWGRSPSVTPTLDELAAESQRWTNAYSCFNVTNPSFISTLTGLYGAQHRVYGLSDAVSESVVTLAEIFRDGGYATYATIAAGHLASGAGLERGFDRFERPPVRLAAGAIVDRALAWFAEGAREKPFFAWLHFFDPHTPNTPMEPYSRGLRPAQPAGLGPIGDWTPFRALGTRAWKAPRVFGEPDLYLGEVSYLDRQIGRLLDYLRSRGLLDNTFVVVWADHGENLGEHGFESRHTGLFETTTHVPLIIRSPGPLRAGVHPELVQNIDLFPTLVAAAGLAGPRTPGQDLFRTAGRRAVFSEGSDHSAERVRDARWALVRNHDLVAPLVEPLYLFDLQADPGETTNLAGRGLAAERELSALLDQWLAAVGSTARGRRLTPSPAGPGDEELRALGYL